MASERASQQASFGVSALLFAVSAAVTIVWCASMSAMGEMPMPGGWTMSMAWMRMPQQTWPGAAAFLGMWVVTMVAMMLPSLVPMLWRYRLAVGRTGGTRLGRLTALVGVGYFFVWTVFGMAAFPLGVALAAIEMQSPALARAVPIAAAHDVASLGTRLGSTGPSIAAAILARFALRRHGHTAPKRHAPPSLVCSARC
jgi:predicted metal-binding membrane protein